MTDPTSLDRLHDIVVPPPAPLWPPAPGIAVILLILAALAVYFLYWSIVRYQRRCYRREALKELSRIAGALDSRDVRQSQNLSSANVTHIAIVLKRAALTAYPRAQIASLTGSPWFEFLDRTANMTAFSGNSGRVLDRLVYGNESDRVPASDDVRELLETARLWVKRHRVINK